VEIIIIEYIEEGEKKTKEIGIGDSETIETLRRNDNPRYKNPKYYFKGSMEKYEETAKEEKTEILKKAKSKGR
jgi:hypothetical protein